MKTCNWNCVYCQLGRTRRFARERRRFFDARTILNEVEASLQACEPGTIDWITLVGSGEPTLNSDLGTMIEHIKRITDTPVAVITNGSLLSRPDVRKELARADAVLPSLDAGTEELFRTINRPRHALTLARHLDGLRRFREEYTGELWVEVMLVASLNDGEDALKRIAAQLGEIEPDRVHLSYPERPPCESWVQPATREEQLRALAILGEAARVLPPTPQDYDFSNGNLEETLVGVIRRHPIPEEEILRHLPSGREDILRTLSESGSVQRVNRYGRWFWTNKEGGYARDR